MSEKITVHIGQAGVQIGHSLWSLFTYEEGITKQGYDNFSNEDCIHDIFFQETAKGKWVPRSCFIDTESVVVDEKIANADLRDLFADEFSVTGHQDSSNCYARGKFYNYQDLQEEIMIAIRRLSEQCSRLNTLSQFGSINGGTGSGLTTALFVTLSDMFPKLLKTFHSVIASRDTVDIITQPYNNIFALAESNELINARYCYDNQTIGNLIGPILKTQFLPVYHGDINHIISLVQSSLTASSRWMGSDEEAQMGINLAPFPSLVMNSPAIVPLNTPKSRSLLTEYTITYDAFLSAHEMTNVDLLTVGGKYISCCLLYRGNVKLKQVNDAINELKSNRQLQFVDWIPTGLKICRCSKRIVHDEANQNFNNPLKSVLKVSNHTAVFSDICEPMMDNFDTLLSNRAYVFWYVGEGMEEGEFSDAAEKLRAAVDHVQSMVTGNVAEEE